MPITEFDPDEYIFIGKVVGFVGPQKLKYVTGDAWGVLVEASEIVNSPRRAARYFEVFPLQNESDCSLIGKSREMLAQGFSIGSKVFVIAKESRFDPAPGGNLRLVISPFDQRLISRTEAEEDSVLATSIYDFRAHTNTRGALAIFEMRKELLRLRKASSEHEKEVVLRRLAYFPDQFVIDYKAIVELHLKDKVVIAQLIAEREAWKLRLKSR